MLVKEFDEYVKQQYLHTSMVYIQTVDKINVRYYKFILENLLADSKYLEDVCTELGISIQEYILTQETRDHIKELKRNLNISKTTNPKKLIQYYLAYYLRTDGYSNIDKYDLESQVNKYLDDDTIKSLEYSIYKYKIDNNESKGIGYGNLDDEIKDKYGINDDSKFKSIDEITKIIEDNFNNIKANADNIMKLKLEKLMNIAGITDYEINHIELTQVYPERITHWISDYTEPYETKTGKTITKTDNLGWVAVIKSLGWNIATNGVNYFISKITNSATQNNNEYFNTEAFLTPLTDEQIIQYLKNKQSYKPCTVQVDVKVTYFKNIYEEGSYSGIGRIYSPDKGIKFSTFLNDLKHPNIKPKECVGKIYINNIGEGTFNINFDFPVKPTSTDDCEKYVEELINNNRIEYRRGSYDQVYGFSSFFKSDKSDVKITNIRIVDKV